MGIPTAGLPAQGRLDGLWLSRIEFAGQREIFLSLYLDLVLGLFDIQQWRARNQVRHAGQADNRGAAVGARTADNQGSPRPLIHGALAAPLLLALQVPHQGVEFGLNIIALAIIQLPGTAKIHRALVLSLQHCLFCFRATTALQQHATAQHQSD